MPVYVENIIEQGLERHENIEKGFEEFKDGVEELENDTLSDEEIDNLVSEMEQNAEQAPVIELTPLNWKLEFGENGIVETPLGQVKMGENQYAKLQNKGRENELGMIKPTLNHPDIVIEDPSVSKKGISERESSYVYAKSFIISGKRVYHFESVTVSKDGGEVVISNHIVNMQRLKNIIRGGKIVYKSKKFTPSKSDMHLSGNQSGLSDLLPTQEVNFSESKGTQNFAIRDNLFEMMKKGDESVQSTMEDIGIEETEIVEDDADVESVDQSIDFKKYYTYKTNLLEKLNKNFETFKKTVPYSSPTYKEKSREYRKAIGKLEEDMKILRGKVNTENVISDVFNEIKYLNKLLDTTSLDKLNYTDFVNRIDMLAEFFTYSSLTKTYVEEGESIFFPLKSMYPEIHDKIKSQVGSLINKYNGKKVEFIQNLALNNPLVTEHIASKKFGLEEITELINKELTKIEDVNWLRSTFLGGSTGGGILGQLIRIYYEGRLREEQGSTIDKINRLQSLWSIVNIKHNDPTSLFIQHRTFTDKDGKVHRLRTDKLIGVYTYTYYNLLTEINESKKTFYQNGSPIMYELLMNKMKKSQEIIDITKLKVFYDLYQNSYPQYFTNSEEDMNAYEQELKDKLGENHYNQVIVQQKQLLEEYTEYARDNNGGVPAQNPFAFVRHFNSENYNKAVVDDRIIFPLSAYSHFIPKVDAKDNFNNSVEYYNKDFDVIKENKDYYEIWNILHSLTTEFINPTLMATGMNVKSFDLPLIEHYLSDEMWKTKNLLGKTGEGMKYLLDTYSKNFSDARFNRSKEYYKEGKIRIEYYNKPKEQIRKLVEFYKNKSYQELKQMAQEKNIPFPDISRDLSRFEGKSEKEKVIMIERNRLANIIAEQEVYQRVDNDLIGNIIALTHITNNARARMSTKGVADIIKSHLGSTNVKRNKDGNIMRNDEGKVETEVNTGTPHLYKFLDNYIRRNIEGDSMSDSNKLRRGEKGIFNRGVFGTKYRDVFDKDLSKKLKAEMKNLKDRNTFDFQWEGSHYISKQENGTWVYRLIDNKKLETSISREQIEEAYIKYIDNTLDNLGIRKTIGSVLLGFQQVMVVKALAINPESGLRNRLEGMMKNYRFAASERFDFSEEDLFVAKRFLSWYNIRRHTKVKNLPNVKNSGKTKQLDTFQLLVKSFGLLQDKKNELSKAHEYSNKKKKSGINLMAFAVDVPENHNQGEIIMALLARNNLKIAGKDGNSYPFFDVATMEFTAYIPGTLKLKDEFRTQFNERVWERFEESSEEALMKITEGENNNEKAVSRNPHIALLSLIETSIERSQGNYNSKDASIAQSSVIGRSLMMFKRYMPEHMMQQYGAMNVDLFTGTKQYKGAKAALLQHTPSAAAYILALSGLSYGSMGLFEAGLGNMLFTLGLGGILPVAVFATMAIILRKKMEKTNSTIMDELRLGIDFTQEMLFRSLDMPFTILSGGHFRKISPFIKATKGISKRVRKGSSENYISEEDRKILSENAVEIAQKVALMAVTTGIKWALTALFEALFGDDDDEVKAKKLKKLELYLNFISNTSNMLITDIDKYSSPTALASDVTQIHLMRTLNDGYKYLNAIENYNRTLKPFDYIPDLMAIVPLPVPRQLVDMAEQFAQGEIPSFFKDARQYQTHWWDYMFSKNEKINDALNKNYRKRLRNQLEDEFFAQIKAGYGDSIEDDLAHELAEKQANSMLIFGNVYGRHYTQDPVTGEYRKQTAGEVLEEIDYKAEIKASKEREKMYK
jgi:hypothetical protein